MFEIRPCLKWLFSFTTHNYFNLSSRRLAFIQADPSLAFLYEILGALTPPPRRQACMRTCSRGGGDSGEGGETSGREVCRLPVQPGSSCKARMRRWAFSAGRCQQFFYSGCDGNGNNFETEEECRAMCSDDSTQPSECPGGRSMLPHIQ